MGYNGLSLSPLGIPVTWGGNLEVPLVGFRVLRYSINSYPYIFGLSLASVCQQATLLLRVVSQSWVL